MKYRLAEITERTPNGMSQRFRCACGKIHLLGVYVFAHWHDRLWHTCECGRRNKVCAGIVQTPVDAPKTRKEKK